ncbi:hypothetical protein [Reyranella sp. CPCC 100927]|uniref:hypothetical protein n=1 Tax=Reyranella sp. CPCC 100927 TaxID=2599616 RepID=UPI0011B82285|nr:hypothetical protein [Reyranella sp. CPCC 100927]TWS94991.1 hypothetical protein FQU96_40800 [Reyranella sp. CPCC 100927]
MAASKATLNKLANLLLAEFIDVLEKGEEVVDFDRDGGAITRYRRRPTAPMLQTIRQALKDSGTDLGGTDAVGAFNKGGDRISGFAIPFEVPFLCESDEGDAEMIPAANADDDTADEDNER